VLQALAAQRHHRQRHSRGGHCQRAHQCNIRVVPDIVRDDVGNGERTESAKEGYPPAFLQATDEVVCGLLESQRKHDENDAEFGEFANEWARLLR